MTTAQWSRGGTAGHSLTLHGAENKGHKKPFKGRVDLWLTIEDNPSAGQSLMYTKSGGDYSEKFCSIGNMNRADEVVTTLEGHDLSRALFNPRELAWLAVEDFLNNEGQRSARIRWFSSDDLLDIFPHSCPGNFELVVVCGAFNKNRSEVAQVLREHVESISELQDGLYIVVTSAILPIEKAREIGGELARRLKAG